MKKSRRNANMISLSEARQAIYIDFEGRKAESPSLIGILCGETFEQVVLDASLKSAADAKELSVSTLEDVTNTLIERCIEGNRWLIAFSPYESKIINEYCGIDLSAHYKNALPFARHWKNKFFSSLLMPKRSLDEFLKLPPVGYQVPKHLGKGNATKRLNGVADMLAKREGYSKLTPVKKRQWTNLLEYNRHDVYGLRALVERAASDFAAS